MHYAVTVPNVGRPQDIINLALEAERVGWDGFFVFDHLQIDRHKRLDVLDSTVLVAAIAASTARIRLGSMIIPLARRRPWKVAKEIITLDHLSGGRVIAGFGLGFPPAEEFGDFGEPTDARERAAILDEALTVFAAVCSGGAVHHSGEHFNVQATLRPGPLQTPRPPIWVACVGRHRGPIARAARWDGVFAVTHDSLGLTATDAVELRAAIGRGADLTLVTLRRPDVGSTELASAGVDWLLTEPPVIDANWLAGFAEVVRDGPLE
jgi:alkanesulfonate monooxygenase SsuD/methylene tetrahydromethanopterin reductase-like flavin-dependent oxidoreductase (luciferase family)